MSFFGLRGSSSSSAYRASHHETHQSELERLRGRQLASLVRAGGRAKNQQQTTFEVAIADTSRGKLFLTLTLPQDFPLKAPQAQVSMPLQHKWLDIAGNVQGHPDLNQWTAHSDLGRIVSEIVNELHRVASSAQLHAAAPANGIAAKADTRRPSSASPSPPQHQLQQSAYSLQAASYTSISSQAQSRQSAISTQQQQQAAVKSLPRTQMPVIPAIFPELEELSVAQLEALATDRHALKAFVKKMHSVQEFMKLREDVMAGNVRIAETTLSHEGEMRTLQGEVQALRSSLRDAQESLAQKQARQSRVLARHRPDALLDQLSAATKELDASSDDLALQFAHGEMDVAQFSAQYLPQRALYHERTIKLNKILQR
uniref:VPS37 C-terminal domain-containing protein n=1 Tax=Globisporangium ultimum (strain ATCC 200006 / CBS 805.95 / DAOM BR144) TaxID=431595 RepID=K3X272_GLOUD